MSRGDRMSPGDRAGRAESSGTNRTGGPGRSSREGFAGRSSREGFTGGRRPRGQFTERAERPDRTGRPDGTRRTERSGSGDRPQRRSSDGYRGRPERSGPARDAGRPERRGPTDRQSRPKRWDSSEEPAPRRAESSVWDAAPGRRRARPSGKSVERTSRRDGTSAWRGAGVGKRNRGETPVQSDRAPEKQHDQDEVQLGNEPEQQRPTGEGEPVPQPRAIQRRREKRDMPNAREGREARESHEARESRDGREVREEGERLQKVLSRAGVGSRREVEDWIRAGRISVNDEPAVLGVRVGPSDRIRLDGRLIRQREVGGSARVFLIHRSPGENLQQPVETPDETEIADELSTESGDETRAGHAQSSSTPLLDRMPRRAGRRFIPVSPMPRVDGGLELVTSDGDLASKLQRSMRRLSSEFSVRVHGELSPQGLETISQGVLDTGEKLQIERCEAAGGEGSNRWYSLVARGASGKDVRQLFERQGALVSRVLRTQLGSLALDRLLSRGQFRELTAEELEALLAAAEGSPP